jgi:hypothetical protein
MCAHWLPEPYHPRVLRSDDRAPAAQTAFAGLDQSWLVKFLEHRIADRRDLRLIQKSEMAQDRSHRGQGMVGDGGRDGAKEHP